MKSKFTFIFLILFFSVFIFILGFLLKNTNLQLLNPRGIVALYERNLLVTLTSLMLACLIPVLFLVFYVVWKYRETNKSATYDPVWDHNTMGRFILWALPCALILTIGIVLWKSTHDLDPMKPLDSTVKPLTIQVVALRWKWLFIYPEQHIATVNFVEFPQKTPVRFELTADAPMNSFWIPQLGGQMYAMAGMVTQVHLSANESGDFAGSAAEINGPGFAGMKFTAKSVSQKDFETWVETVKKTGKRFGVDEYNTLSLPSEDNPAATYELEDGNLYNKIVMKYMPKPNTDMQNMQQ